MLTTILIVLLVVMLIGPLPAWPHPTAYGPSGASDFLLVVLLILFLTEHL